MIRVWHIDAGSLRVDVGADALLVMVRRINRLGLLLLLDIQALALQLTLNLIHQGTFRS